METIQAFPKIIYSFWICVFWCKQDGDKIVQYTYKRKDSNKQNDPCYPDKIPVSICVTSYFPVFAMFDRMDNCWSELSDRFD